VSRRPPERVHAAAARVALATAAIVAVVYTIIAVVVALIVTSHLTSDIDGRLSSSIRRISAEPLRPLLRGGYPVLPGGSRFGPPLIIWTISPIGEVTSTDTSAILPDGDRGVKGPTTISVGGTDVRVAGAPVGDNYVVVGQTTESVAQARSTVVLAELIVGPILLGIVFLGALSIGRRVGTPIEQARQRQMEFTADASHELRTPLSVIEAQTSLALAQDRDAAWYRTAFRRIDVESKRIRRLVEDLLWLARFDATSAQPNAEHVDVAVLAAQAVDRFAGVAESRRIRLGVTSGGGMHIVTAPPEWLDRLLGVLLDNACKYSPEGGRVDVVVAEEGNRVRLAVEDSGPGIPDEERSRIFDRFHRATDRAGGAGLGLAIGDAVVRASGGRWDIGTSSAGGASMAVMWPRALPGARETPRRAAASSPQ